MEDRAKGIAAVLLIAIAIGLVVLVVARLMTIDQGAETADLLEEARSRACECHDRSCADRQVAAFMALLRSHRSSELSSATLQRSETASLELVDCLKRADVSPEAMARLADFLANEFGGDS